MTSSVSQAATVSRSWLRTVPSGSLHSGRRSASAAVVASMNSLWAAPEIEHALASCEPTVLIADRERLARVPPRTGPATPSGAAFPYRTIELETDFDDLVARGRGAAISEIPIDEDDPAVILYTSGTTGRSQRRGRVASIDLRIRDAEQVLGGGGGRGGERVRRRCYCCRRHPPDRTDHGSALPRVRSVRLRRRSARNRRHRRVAIQSLRRRRRVASDRVRRCDDVGRARQHGPARGRACARLRQGSLEHAIARGGRRPGEPCASATVARGVPERVDQHQHGLHEQ